MKICNVPPTGRTTSAPPPPQGHPRLAARRAACDPLAAGGARAIGPHTTSHKQVTSPSKVFCTHQVGRCHGRIAQQTHHPYCARPPPSSAPGIPCASDKLTCVVGSDPCEQLTRGGGTGSRVVYTPPPTHHLIGNWERVPPFLPWIQVHSPLQNPACNMICAAGPSDRCPASGRHRAAAIEQKALRRQRLLTIRRHRERAATDKGEDFGWAHNLRIRH